MEFLVHIPGRGRKNQEDSSADFARTTIGLSLNAGWSRRIIQKTQRCISMAEKQTVSMSGLILPSERSRSLLLAEHVPQHLADFAQGSVAFDAFQDGGDGIVLTEGNLF